jgi:membrane peptidoglycan carboxypeptidase
MALGQDSLSVNEQDTMLATLDNNGLYHQAHLIQQITQGTAVYPAKVPSWQVLTPAQDSQVQYAMSFDTTGQGTGTAAAMNDGRPIIAKTGTTNDAQSAFFIGAIQQYSLTVGIFTDKQGKTTETLNGLGGNAGGGFGGYWPARIWKTFAESAFAPLPVQQFPAPQFSGQAWNMLSSGMMPATTPSAKPSATAAPPPQKGHHHTPPPSSPATPPATSPAPTAPAQPTCGPLTGTPCNGNGGGNGGPPAGGAAGGAAGFVALVPVRWLLAKRKRKRN